MKRFLSSALAGWIIAATSGVTAIILIGASFTEKAPVITTETVALPAKPTLKQVGKAFSKMERVYEEVNPQWTCYTYSDRKPDDPQLPQWVAQVCINTGPVPVPGGGPPTDAPA